MDMVSWCRRLTTPLAVAALLLCTHSAHAQALDESFRTDIEKLLEVTGSSQLGTQMASLVSRQILEGLKQSQPDIPTRMIELAQQVLDEEFAKAFTGPDSLTSRIVAVYAKHFTQADVRGLLAFYGTDLGKKVIAALPIIFQESAAAGQEWSAQHMPEIMATFERRLRLEGLPK
jgi:hypothetical protein